MNQPLISVIVPVYNSEQYLDKCIASILNQTYPNIEVILVDDGSTDKSPEICDKYAGVDVRVSVIHQQNLGVAASRQKGIDAASGHYIIHVDSDDWIEPNMFESMAEVLANGYDMVICDLYYEKTKSNYTVYQSDVFDSKTLLLEMLQGGNMGSLCNKMIKTDFCKPVEFDGNLFYCEDFLYLIKILINNNIKVKNIHSPFYHYLQQDSSITHSYSKKTFDNRFNFISKLKDLIGRKNELWNEHISCLYLNTFYESLKYRVYDKEHVTKIMVDMPSSLRLRIPRNRWYVRIRRQCDLLLKIYDIPFLFSLLYDSFESYNNHYHQLLELKVWLYSKFS